METHDDDADLRPRMLQLGRQIAGRDDEMQRLAEALAAAERSTAELQEALKTSREIGMAMGIVIANREVTPDVAFNVLRRLSQSTGLKLREVAAYVVMTGDAPNIRPVDLHTTG